MATNPKSNVNKTAVAVGAGVLGAAAIGAYWLYGAKSAPKNRKLAKSWMLKARAEIMDTVEKLKDIDKEKYYQIVEAAISKYSKTNSAADISSITKEMKSAWSQIHSAIGTVKKPAAKKKAKTSK